MTERRAPKPKGLGTRGSRLWRELTAEKPFPPAERVLLEEACRLADRLEKLDELLRGDIDCWARLVLEDDGRGEFEIHIDKAVAEARQQALALRQIVATLFPKGPAKPEQAKPRSVSDELRARRAARRAAPAGL